MTLWCVARRLHRSNLDRESRAKSKNPNYFVSQTRLSVHNVPVTVADKELRALFLAAAVSAAGDRRVKIAQCKVRLPSHKFSHSLAQKCICPGNPEQSMFLILSPHTPPQIVRSKDRVDADGESRSKGFAFVEFAEHQVRP